MPSSEKSHSPWHTVGLAFPVFLCVSLLTPLLAEFLRKRNARGEVEEE